MTCTTPADLNASPRKRIVILGAGVGAMAAAYELTSQPNWYDRYEIAIYQLGWRFGGKGASGHQADKYERIEEHGLHIWWGFYDNSFDMMKQCYSEVALPNLSFNDAFKPQHIVTFMDQLRGQWFKHEFNFPPNPFTPGSIDTAQGLWQCVQRAIEWLRDEFLRHKDIVSKHLATHPMPATESMNSWMDPEGEAAMNEAHRMANPPMPARTTREVAPWIKDGAKLIELLNTFRKALKIPNWLLEIVDTLRWFYILIDFAITVTIGLISDGVFTNPEGLNSIEKYEFSAWLIRHGINQKVTLPSVLVRGLYDAAFCFIAGDPNQPNVGAGTIMRATIRMIFTYKGAFMWRMQGGMGDVIFAPLYLMLKKRGDEAEAATGRKNCMRLEFFHRVDNVGLIPVGGTAPLPGDPQIETIRMTRQATIKGVGNTYNPFIWDSETKLPWWPLQPLYDQLVEGEQIKQGPPPHEFPYDLESNWTSWPGVGEITLERGVDFDYVVMGISLGALQQICPELVADARQNGAWANMVQNVKTTRTMGLQMWFNKTAAELGWVSPELAVMDAYYDPLNSWADMSQVLPHERWPPADPPKTVSYFCGPLLDDPNQPTTPDDGYQRSQDEVVYKASLSFWTQYYEPLYPNASAPGTKSFNWNLLWAPSTLLGEARFAYQYFHANINGSERYVLSVADTFKYRLQPDKSGYANLFLTGDWTNNGLNFGCVESATLGGLIGARGLLAALPAPASPVEPLTTPGNPNYVEYGGLQVWAPPYSLQDVTLQVYPLLGSNAAMQASCDKYLNAASGDYQFKAIGDLVFVQLGYIGINRSLTAPDSSYGYGPETSSTFFFPVLMHKRGTFEYSVGLFTPYIQVDNSLSLCTGREVFGIPKEIGWFSYNLGPKGDPNSVETLVFPKLDPTTELQRRVLLGTAPTADSVTRAPWESGGTPIDAILQDLYNPAHPERRGAEVISADEHKLMSEAIKLGELPLYCLRQLRNPLNPGKTSFSEITKSVMSVEKLLEGGFLSVGQRVTIQPYESHPIVVDLMGRPLVVTTLNALLPFYVRFNGQLRAEK